MSNGETGNMHSNVAALREICIKEVNKHMRVLEKQVWDLPASLIKDILPHLNIFYLERIEPAAKCKGVSTGTVWAALWRDLAKAWRCRSGTTVSADEWRQKCLERLFHLALFGGIRLDKHYLSNLSWSAILSLTAKYVQALSLFGSAREICKLASDELRPVLASLEKNVRCIKLRHIGALFKQGHADMLYIFHRLLDHGSVSDLVLTRNPDTRLLTWILQKDSRNKSGLLQADSQHFTAFRVGERTKPPLHGASVSSCGTCEHEISDSTLIRSRSWAMDNDTHLTPYKRPRLDVGQMSGAPETSTGCPPSQSISSQPMDSECLFPPFTPSCSMNGDICPKGQIHSLVLDVFKDNISRALSPLLPSCVCLRSLHFHSEWAIEEADVLQVVEALKLLFENPACSLTDLSIGLVSSSMPMCTLLLQLLTACPTLKSLCLEASALRHQTECVTPAPQLPADTVFSLERLSLRFPQGSENLENLTLVLRPASSLSALHLTGIHNGGQELGSLLQSLPELNPNLKTLTLDDVNLAHCHSEVLTLLNNSKLEDMHFKDCRLLEKCEVKEDFLIPFVMALKGVSSLRSLTLSRNRLANGVIALGNLFSGESPSRIQRLDIRCNYILPMGLLEFGRMLEDNPPPPGLTIDLRCNPLDRDPQVTEQALLKLRPLCCLLTDNWNSRTTMADHISVM